MSRHTGSHAFLLVSIFACLLFLSFSLSTLAQECETQADIRINGDAAATAAGWFLGGDLKIGRGTANPTVINQPNQQ